MRVKGLKKDPAGAEALRALQQYHVNLHVAAYEKDHVRPKMHFSLPIPEQVLRFHKLLDCFCCERKNSAFKNLMQTKGFARDFNKPVLLELVSQELHAAQEAERRKGEPAETLPADGIGYIPVARGHREGSSDCAECH